ncbi:MAG: UTP--glucose-1-phosphate uridylyltransferase GalU [Beijerinckiaceae bacterium]
MATSSKPARIRKAIFPVAGLGTRVLPATKSIPKEMLTLVDKPVLQVVMEEAREAGIEHFVFVTGRNKQVIEDHFDMAYELEDSLLKRGKIELLNQLKADRPAAGATSFTRQQEPLGLGHAVWCARDIIGDEPFAVLLPDMITIGKTGCLKQCMDVYNSAGGNVIAVEECDPALAHQYGIVGIGKEVSKQGHRITGMVEKPAQGTAPSNLYITGRYILQPEIFKILEKGERGAGGEIQLTDGMVTLMKKQAFHSMTYNGVTYDCGSKIGYLQATVAYALSRKDLAEDAKREIAALLAK